MSYYFIMLDFFLLVFSKLSVSEFRYSSIRDSSYLPQQNISAHVRTGILVAKHVSAVLQWLVHDKWINKHEAGLAEYAESEIKLLLISTEK